MPASDAAAPAVPVAPSARADTRRAALVRAAYDLIAAHGLEGLRTRDIAARAGVNIATLHYYFPTKEALIAGVAGHLAQQFVTVGGPPVVGGAEPALDRLRQEFADARVYQSERPDMLVVMQELMLRARRDPAVAAIVAPLTQGWRMSIERMVAGGIAAGVFRPELDPAAAADHVMAALGGVLLLNLPPPALARVCAALEHSLRISPEE
jgi:AcrR family transcriptional regulator